MNFKIYGLLPIILGITAAILAYYKQEGWGWFLFCSIFYTANPIVEFIKEPNRKAPDKNLTT